MKNIKLFKIKAIIVILISLMSTTAFSGNTDFCSPEPKDLELMGAYMKDINRQITDIFKMTRVPQEEYEYIVNMYPMLEQEYDEEQVITHYLKNHFGTEDRSNLPTDPNELQNLKDRLKDDFDSSKKLAMQFVKVDKCGIEKHCTMLSLFRYAGLEHGFDVLKNPIFFRYFKAGLISKEEMVEEMGKDGWLLTEDNDGVYQIRNSNDEYTEILKKLFPNSTRQNIKSMNPPLGFEWNYEDNDDQAMKTFINDLKHAKSSQEYHGIMTIDMEFPHGNETPVPTFRHAFNVVVAKNPKGELEVLLYGLYEESPDDTEESMQMLKQYLADTQAKEEKQSFSTPKNQKVKVKAIDFLYRDDGVAPIDFFRNRCKYSDYCTIL